MGQDADQRLVEAVHRDDGAAVEKALADGADPDAGYDRFRSSVLAVAAHRGNGEIVDRLLRAGARVEAIRPRGATPLRVAVAYGLADIVRSLLRHGALTVEPAGRGSVLTTAVSVTSHRSGPAHLAVLRLLLEAGAAPAPGEEEPLLTAVMLPHVPPAVLRLLLAHGANPDQRRSDGAPAIVVAARRGDHAQVDVLLTAGAAVDARDRHGRTALMHAAERGEQRVVATLLLAGADPGATGPDGTTAPHLTRGWPEPHEGIKPGGPRNAWDEVPVVRSAVRVTPAGVRLDADQRLFRLLADVIGRAVASLGDEEWTVRTGMDADLARAFATRLRDGGIPSADRAWHRLDITADEHATIHSALDALAHGRADVPDRLELVDLLDELRRQHRR
ncbi:ankyrin repeat domain-containing protein [Catenuloplanes indicus]|uniref:Ankyrin repeat protein n=1 Tax=Catenuloplanes indicus TaxID=137267 RepID=A0AAE3VXG8_9ACTN|nr:ankyrin repeat domain-containing protein [Catenuloplanes indicus]MDQ0365382.1 ankyrin repeat protein [Catenuloplanes indicus]